VERTQVQDEPVAPAALAESPTFAVGVPRLPRGLSIGWAWAQAVARIAYGLAALGLFVLALEVLKTGAGGLKPVLDGLSAEGTPGLLGFGWLGSYLVLSGSPVAAIALSLFSGGAVSDIEAFAMINGTRLGASFIVLFVGFLYYVSGRRNPDGIYIGVVALLVAFTVWAPVVPIGRFILMQGWFDGVRLGSPGLLTSFVDTVYDPVVSRMAGHLPLLVMFGTGVGLMLAAFSVFDRVLPNLEQPGPRFERLAANLHRPLPMFVLGLLVTGATLSVSLSLTILVPLTLKGYVRRRQIIPYVMGANIATWVDTLFAALLLDTPRAFTIVFTEMVVGAAISLLVLSVGYEAYRRAILWAAHNVTRSRGGFAVFLGAILLVPLLLLLV
jgi:Na+/phosphate symporter